MSSKPFEEWSKEELVSLAKDLLLFLHEVRDDAHNRALDIDMYLDRRHLPNA